MNKYFFAIYDAQTIFKIIFKTPVHVSPKSPIICQNKLQDLC